MLLALSFLDMLFSSHPATTGCLEHAREHVRPSMPPKVLSWRVLNASSRAESPQKRSKRSRACSVLFRFAETSRQDLIFPSHPE